MKLYAMKRHARLEQIAATSHFFCGKAMSFVSRPFLWLAESLFGFDYFISYSWVGGAEYALALHKSLQNRGMRCFLDRNAEGFTVGSELKVETDRATRHSSALVIVVEPNAFRSRYVPKEVEIFERRGRLIIPIDVDDTLAQARLDTQFAATLTESKEAAAMLATLINKVGPKELASKPKAPSREVTEKLVESFRYTRRMARRTRTYGAFSFLLAIIAVTAYVFMTLANRRAHIANSRRLVTLSQAVPASLPGIGRRLDVPEIFPQRKLLLAIEAIGATLDHGETVLPDAEQSIRDAIGSIQGIGLARQPSGITAATVTRDGRLITAGEDRKLRILNLKAPVVASRELGTQIERTTTLIVLPDGRLAAGDDGGTVQIWNLEMQGTVPEILGGNLGRVLSLAITPDGRLVAGGMDGRAVAWDLTQPNPKVTELVRQEEPINTLAFAKGGYLVTGGASGKVCVWYRPGEQTHQPRTIDAHEGGVTRVAFTREDQIVSAGIDGAVMIRNLDVRENIRTLGKHTGEVTALACAPDGRLVTAGIDRTIRIWTIPSDENGSPVVKILQGHDGTITSIEFDPDGCMISAGQDGTIRKWDIAYPTIEPLLVNVHEKSVASLVFLGDGRLVSSSTDGSLHMCTFSENGVARQELSGPEVNWRKHIIAMATTTDSRLVIRRSRGPIQISSRITNKLTFQDFPPSPSAPGAFAVSSSGMVFAATWGGTVWKWNSSRLHEPPQLLLNMDHQDLVTSLTISPDGKTLFARFQDASLKAWVVQPSVVPLELPARIRSSVSAVVFSPDGHIVTSKADGGVTLWKVTKQGLEPTQLRHGSRSYNVNSSFNVMAFCSKDKLIGSGFDGGIHILSDIDQVPVILRRIEDKVVALVTSNTNMAVSPDGCRLVCQSGSSGTVEVWTIELNHLLEKARRIAGRNFTEQEWFEYFPGETYRETLRD